MEPQQDSYISEMHKDRWTASEMVAATVCGAVLGAGVLFAIAEVWARGAVEGTDAMPLAYVLAAIGALLGAAVVLAYLRSDHMHSIGELTDATFLAEDYTLAQAPLAPMAWHPVPVVLPVEAQVPVEAAPETIQPRRTQRRPRRRGHAGRPSARRASLSAQALQRPPAQA